MLSMLLVTVLLTVTNVHSAYLNSPIIWTNETYNTHHTYDKSIITQGISSITNKNAAIICERNSFYSENSQAEKQFQNQQHEVLSRCYSLNSSHTIQTTFSWLLKLVSLCTTHLFQLLTMLQPLLFISVYNTLTGKRLSKWILILILLLYFPLSSQALNTTTYSTTYTTTVSNNPTPSPTNNPTPSPTNNPTPSPTNNPTPGPTPAPTMPPTTAGATTSLPTTYNPTVPPSQPSKFPTTNPTMEPTPEPTRCLLHNDGWSALSNDGAEDNINMLIAGISLNYYDYGIISSKVYSAAQIAEFATRDIAIKDDQHQYLNCSNIVSCLQSVITFTNNTVCYILCKGLLSCGSAKINIDSCSYIYLTCFNEQACDSANVTITNASQSNINIYCVSGNACGNMKIDILGNTTSTNITCIEANTCDDIKINVDDFENTLLIMYDFSQNVIFDNKAGFLSYDRKEEYIQCNTKYKYIEWNDTLATHIIDSLILNEYALSKFPCSGVTVKCKADLNDTVSNASCVMDYTIDTAFSVPTPSPTACYWVSVEDLVQSSCFGACASSPTDTPTAAPTNTPTKITVIPTNAPSIAPSIAPSSAPTIPTKSPTNIPTNAPTDNPTPSPSLSPTQPPSISPSPAPTIPPTVGPTGAPSESPTQAPTRNPTSSKYDFNSMIKIVYVLVNLNDENNNFIMNNTLNHGLEFITEIIESHYYSTKFLSSYEYFTVKINTVNDVNYKKQDLFTKDNVLYNDFGVFRDEMYLESQVEFDNEYANYVLPTSKDPDWYTEVSDTFRGYFNNSIIEFYVENPQELEVILDEPPSSFGFTFWSLNAMLFLCVMVGVVAWIYNNNSPGWHSKTFRAVDESDWLSIILYGVQIYDIVSDLNLTSEIFVAISEERSHVAGEDREGIVDTPKEWILFLSGWFSVLCTAVPYGLNIWAAVRIPTLTSRIVCARNYFQTYRIIFIFLVIFSGGAYPALALVTSKLFGLEMLDSGLSRFEMNSLVKIRVVTTVLTENVPQLIVQIMYSYAISDISQNTVLAFCTSVASIIASVMIYCMNKEQQSDTRPIDYYLEVKKVRDANDDTESKNYGDINGTGVALAQEEKENIEMNRGVTKSLAKKMTAIHGDIDMTNYQVAYVHLRNDNFVIRIVQQAHIEDLNLVDDEFELKDEMDMKKQFSTHCLSEYSKHRKELNSTIFDHYGIDGNLFKVIYHQKYPTVSSKTNGRNIQKEEGIELVEMNNKSGYDALTEYRESIFKGLDIIKQETDNLPQTSGVTTLQINRFIQTLSDHKMNHRVIEDVLSVAVKAGTFKQHQPRDSDIDGSSDEESQKYLPMEQEGQ